MASCLLSMTPRLLRFVAILHIFVSSCNGAKQILCDNAGLQYAMFKGNPTGQWYSAFDPNYMKDPSIPGGQGTKYLIYNSVTNKIGGAGCPDPKANLSLYDSPKILPCQSHTIMFRGYINPSVSGVFAFNLHAMNDFAFLWLGARARSGWNRRNHDLEACYDHPWYSQNQSRDGNNATLVWLDAGSYYPIRMVHASYLKDFNYMTSIVDPYGNTLLGANTGPSTSIVQYSCDGDVAPDWDAWGREA